MEKLAFIALIALGPASGQDPAAAQDPADLIEGLRSDDIAVRERSYAGLEKLGGAAESHLKKAARTADPDAARSARALLRILELERTFSPALKNAVPGIARRLARQEDEDWTRVYLEPNRSDVEESLRASLRRLTRSDLEPLAPAAVRRALTVEDKIAACQAVENWFHRNAEPEVIALLHDGDTQVRDQALQTLRQLRGRGALTIVLKEYADDLEGLAHALHEIRAFGPVEAIPRLIEMLQNGDSEIRSEAAGWLECLNAHEAVPTMVAMLRNPDPALRETAVCLASGLGTRAGQETILSFIDDPAPRVRAAALNFAIGRGLEISAGRMRTLLEDPDEGVCRAALGWAGLNADAAWLPLVRKNLVHPESSVRASAMALLVSLKDPALPNLLIPLLRDPDSCIRRQAAALLARLDAARGTPALARVVEDRNEEIWNRAEALLILKDLKPPPPPDLLMRLVHEERGLLATEAIAILLETSPESLRPEVERLLFDEEFRESSLLVKMMKRFDSPEQMSLLLKALKGPAGARSKAISGLVALNADSAVSQLKAMLKHDNAQARREALEALGRLKALDARGDVVALLEDSEVAVRKEALETLDHFGIGTDAAAVRNCTRDESMWVRRTAAEILRRNRVMESIPDLRRLLDDPESSVAEESAKALVEWEVPELAAKASGWLDSAQPGNFNLGCNVLAILGASEGVKGGLALLDDREQSRRAWGAWLLGRCGGEEQARLLVPLLKERGSGAAASSAISMLGGRNAVPDLVALLGEPDVVPRGLALETLSDLGASEACPDIRALLLDPDIEIRCQAIGTLGQFGDRMAVPRIVGALKERAALLRRAAVIALRRIGAREAGPALLPLVNDPVGDVRREALRALAELRVPDFIPELLRRLRDPADPDRESIIDALGAAKVSEAVPELSRMIQKDPLKIEAVEALVAIGTTEAKAVLRCLIARESEFGPLRLAAALARLGDSSVMEGNLKDPKPEVRLEAAEYLCAEGNARGVPELMKIALDNGEVDLSTLNAVRKPKMRASLASIRFRGYRGGTPARLVNRVALDAGVKVRWNPGKDYQGRLWLTECWHIGRSDRWVDSFEALRDLFSRRTPWDFILEDDGLRILPREMSLEFWKKWWADEQAKKK